MKKNIFKILTFVLFITSNSFADIENSKDPAEIKRYEGSEIVRYEHVTYDKYTVPLGKITNFDFNTKVAQFEKSESLEGDITRVSYRLADPQRSSLEVYRNYESALTEAGWLIQYKASGKQEYGNSFTHIYESLKNNDQLFTYNDAQGHFLVASKATEGLTAVLFVTKFENGLSGNTKVEKGEPIIQLDVVKTKQMDQKMILVTSSQMEKSITDSGKVSLYGILFDFNKADIKVESEATLQQIANLLNEKKELKLLIVGHTDNVGDFEFNRDLSQKRAASVTNWLVEKYKIFPSRLTSFGASFASPVASNDSEDGRTKNRRVELVSIK